MTASGHRSDACRRARAQVSALLDRELTDFEAAQLALHLRVCASCRAFEIDARRLIRYLNAAPLERLEFQVDVPRSRRIGARQLQSLAVTSIALAVAYVLWGVGTFGPHRELGDRAGGAASTAQGSAYLESADYERVLIAGARAARESMQRGGTGQVPARSGPLECWEHGCI